MLYVIVYALIDVPREMSSMNSLYQEQLAFYLLLVEILCVTIRYIFIGFFSKFAVVLIITVTPEVFSNLPQNYTQAHRHFTRNPKHQKKKEDPAKQI